jgi:glutathione S-transferase
MLEKGIPFELKNEIPWHSTTETPQYNPLEKLPILIFDDGKSPIYESWYIQEYLVQKYKGTGPALIPESLDDQLLAKKIQVLADGACDAMGLAFFESGRGGLKSEEWYARQLRKVNGVLKAMDELVKQSGGSYLVGDEFSIADIAVGSMLGLMNMAETQFGLVKWLEQYPKLKKYWRMLEARDSFQQTQPVMFELTEKVA